MRTEPTPVVRPEALIVMIRDRENDVCSRLPIRAYGARPHDAQSLPTHLSLGISALSEGRETRRTTRDWLRVALAGVS